jgi:serine protease Do
MSVTAADVATERGRTVDAAVVGVAPEIDLALLRVSDVSLPALRLADYHSVRQGELVFAFGSPQGFRGSVTMGVVSAVARQPNAENPMVYIQTDAPINHGNSGGPLVNVQGELVGINTFMLSDSGGSQGLGFAIPSALVSIAYPKLRQFGHLHRGEVGLQMQTVTPSLAAGLHLAQETGVMIADVAPGSAAESAGLQPKDLIVSLDTKPIADLPSLGFDLFTRGAGDTLHLMTLRGTERRAVDVVVRERPRDLDRLTNVIDPKTSLIAKLGIYAVPLDGNVSAMRLASRVTAGVVVVGHAPDNGDALDTGLLAARSAL